MPIKPDVDSADGDLQLEAVPNRLQAIGLDAVVRLQCLLRARSSREIATGAGTGSLWWSGLCRREFDLREEVLQRGHLPSGLRVE